MQSEDEIHEIMDSKIGYENVCLGLENTNKVADLIENVDMPFQKPQLPTFPLPDGYRNNKILSIRFNIFHCASWLKIKPFKVTFCNNLV